KVGAQVDVDSAGLVFDDGLGNPVDRLMGSPPGPVSIRPRLEIRLEDRLQDEFQRSLDHTITDRRNRENADLAPVLRNFLSPCPHGPIRLCYQFIPYLPEESLHPTLLDGFECDPIISRCPIVTLRHLIGGLQRLHLADVDIQPQKRQAGSAFALTYRLLLRSCKPM